MRITQTLRRHPGRAAAVAVVLAGIGALALWWFAPWNLFIDRTVDEALPGVTATPAEGATGVDQIAPEVPEADAAGETGVETQPQPGGGAAEEGEGGVQTLFSGAFGSLEHETTGDALIVELQDGRRFLRLADLETSNGPDLRVYLTDQPFSDDWYLYDDGAFVDLGGLKGNIGNSNYEIPADVDLADFQTAVIWCRRFAVGFAVAPLDPPS